MKRLLACLLSGVLLLTGIFAPMGVRAEGTQAPLPVIADLRPDAVFLERHEGYEYSNDGVSWGQSGSFSGLLAETDYTFYQRAAGKQSTVSRPLTVKTLPKTPCTAELLQPMLDYCRTTTISLVSRSGYEYRINGGSWQTEASFSNLKPDTEYVFEQRIRETPRELASAVSEPLVVRTRTRGPSTSAHYNQLLAYIEENGESAEGSPKGIGYILQDEMGADYYFWISNADSDLLFELLYDGVEETNLAFDMQFAVDEWSNTFNVTNEVILVDGEYIVDQVKTLKTLDKKKYSTTYNFAVPQEGNYLTSEMLSQLGDAALKTIFAFWDELFYAEFGFGMKGLGFTAYEGLGEICCDPRDKYHLGNRDVAYDRKPGCGTYGRTYDLFCTVCGELVEAGVYIAPTSDHIYDSDCDNECNNCGYHRAIVHKFIYGCAEKCTVCGFRRETTFAEHAYDQNGICTVCGEVHPDKCLLTGTATGFDNSDTLLTLLRNGKEVASLTVSGSTYVWKGLEPGDYTLTAARDGHVTYRTDLTVTVGANKLDLTLCRPGDVVGIGTLNMGDFAAIYAHVKRTAVLSGYALDCADFDGNDAVNIGDVAGLYAKIRNGG